MVESEHLQVRKHRKTECPFSEDVLNTLVSYHDVGDSVGPILSESVNECSVSFWQTGTDPKPNLPEDFDTCDQKALQLRVMYISKSSLNPLKK